MMGSVRLCRWTSESYWASESYISRTSHESWQEPERNVVTNGGHVIMRNRVTQSSLRRASSSGTSKIVDRSVGKAEEPVRVSEGSWNGDWGRWVMVNRKMKWLDSGS